MKKILPVIIVVAIVAALAVWYFSSGPANIVAPGTGSNAPNAPLAPIPVPSVPVPASSYGKNAVGSTSTNSTGLVKPQPTEAVGILRGSAKLAAGAIIKLTSVKVAISDPQTNKVLDTASLGADGTYQFTVLPGEYIVSIVPGTGSSAQLPQRVYVGANERIDANFSVK